MAEITLAKGSITVTIYAREVVDNLSNQLFPIKPPQTKNNQSSGPKDNKIIDLLRITREYLITGAIKGTDTQTAKQVKDELYSIGEGAGIDGGVVTLTYDGDTITGYIEKISAKEKAEDTPASEPVDYAKYEVQINFMKGVLIG